VWSERICQSCGHGNGGNAHAQEAARHPHGMHHELLEVHSDPEAHWESMGEPAHTAPYVWETNY